MRQHWGNILREVIALAKSTERLETAYLFGSFVTAKAAPADIDLFLVMSRDFSISEVEGRARLLFDSSRAAIVWGYTSTGSRHARIARHSWQLGNSGGIVGDVASWRCSDDYE